MSPSPQERTASFWLAIVAFAFLLAWWITGEPQREVERLSKRQPEGFVDRVTATVRN